MFLTSYQQYVTILTAGSEVLKVGKNHYGTRIPIKLKIALVLKN